MPTKTTRGAQAAPTTRRAALYPRVSDPYGDRKRQPTSERQQETPLDQQESACRAYAEQHGYTVMDEHIYREAHTGVELWERPQLTRLREAIRRREIDVVVCYSIDRLSRDPVHLGVLLSEAEHAGVAVEFVTEPLDNSDEGQLIRFVKGYAAKVEHAKIKDRTIRGKRARAAAGKLIPGPRPRYGYQWNDDRTRLLVDDVTAPIVRRMFAAALTGRSVRAIVTDLTRDAIPRPTGPNKNGENGTRWVEQTVWQILTTPAYAGDAAAWACSKTGPAMPLPEGTVPPLVSRAEFDAVQARLKINKAAAARNNRHPEETLLRGGYARCGHCGWTMYAHRLHCKGYTSVIYRCSRGTTAGYRGECQHTISARVLDGAVWAHVEELLTHPETIAAELERMRGEDPSAADLAAVERSLTQVAREQRNYVENLGKVKGTAADLIANKINALETQRAQLSAERDAVLARSKTWQAAQDRLTDLQAWCRTAAVNLGTMTYQERRTALDGLGVEAKVWRTDHEPRYKIRAAIPLDGAASPIVSSTTPSSAHNMVEFVWTDKDEPARELAGVAALV